MQTKNGLLKNVKLRFNSEVLLNENENGYNHIKTKYTHKETGDPFNRSVVKNSAEEIVLIGQTNNQTGDKIHFDLPGFDKPRSWLGKIYEESPKSKQFGQREVNPWLKKVVPNWAERGRLAIYWLK